MPDLIDDALSDDRLIDDLRRYGAAVEAMADRYSSPPDYPVAPTPRPAGAVDAEPSPRRRTAVLVAAASVALLVGIAVVALARRTDDPGPVIDTPPTAGVPAATGVPFADGTVLMWLPYEGPPQFLGEGDARPLPLYLGRSTAAGCCGVATVNTTAAFFAGGTLHLVDRSGRVDDTGVSGERVVADRDAGAFYVVRSGQLARYPLPAGRPLSGGIDGQWALPDGWQLPSDGSTAEVLDGEVILERADVSSANQEVAVWRPDTGELRSIGTARSVIDATTYPNGVPVVAWLDDDCDSLSTGCGLVITNLDTMESRMVARPEFGFIGGGAFSDDGRRLAVFVAGQENMPVDPSAELAVVDVDTLAMRGLPGTNVAVGEPYGSAAWTADGSSVIFHGLSETRVIDITTGAQRTLPWEITYSMATIP